MEGLWACSYVWYMQLHAGTKVMPAGLCMLGRDGENGQRTPSSGIMGGRQCNAEQGSRLLVR